MGLFSIFKKSNNLYFPGDLTYFKFHENFELYKQIFSKLGISFVVLNKQFSSGLDALEAGYETEARKIAKKNFDIFKENEIKSIITSSPECYKMFLQNYPELLPDWDIEIKNMWKIILDKLENNPGLIRNRVDEIVSYHDSCCLGRYCKVFDEPRKILELIGYKIKEMPDSKENSICCGSCGGVPRTNPKLADKIAKQRILQAKRIKVDTLIVCSLANYEILKKNAGEDIKIMEFSEVLAYALGIKNRKDESNEENRNEEDVEDILLESRDSEEVEREELNDEEPINLGGSK